MKLNVLSVMASEKLLKKPFSSFDFSDEETLKTVIYCMYSASVELCTQEQFENSPDVKKNWDKFVSKLHSSFAYLSQFSDPEENVNEDGEKVWITSLINRLIALGKVSQKYVLTEMELWEISDLVKASEESAREDMENRRFWAYLQMLPHVDSKKVKNPQDLITFPWEEEEMEKERLSDLERDSEMFYKFFNSKPLKS